MSLLRLRVLAPLLLALPLTVALPSAAHAYTAEGFQFFKAHDFVLTAVNPGVMAYTGGPDKATFGLGTNFDYHLTPNIAVGALIDMGFGENFIGFDFGPQFKYKFKLGSESHFPFVRAAVPARIMLVRGNAFIADQTVVAVGILVGGGYRFYFHRRVGVGADLALVPAFHVSGPGSFSFGINFTLGVEFKL